ncbi:hypothetical protein [Mesorhizobium mediterraneum]|uniref:hypothetical protein n=1 Tax=Mesorhizobium mediterraneum TaxID=43617 RepID=UPI001780B1EE|nr:hypothetical protein [Mesorhizobium mediterraneum]
MATLNASLIAIEQHMGFPQSRSRTVSRRLQERDVIPIGAPGVAPELEAHDVVSLIIALAADTALHEAPDAVERYRALTPGGVDLTDAPASLDTAGRALDIFADIAIHGSADLLRRDRIEFVSNFAEVAIHDATSGRTKRFAPVGHALGSQRPPQEHDHQRQRIVDAINALFGRK